MQELPARVQPFIEKTLGQGTRLERLRVEGDPAFFITGAHGFAYEGEGGVRFEDQRLAGNTLLVERADGLLLRIEGDLTRDRAVAIARYTPSTPVATPKCNATGVDRRLRPPSMPAVGRR